MKSIGQAAYDAWRSAVYASNPEWEELPKTVQHGWNIIAQAVLKQYAAENAKLLRKSK